jgi:hypothetical protein
MHRKQKDVVLTLSLSSDAKARRQGKAEVTVLGRILLLTLYKVAIDTIQK